MNIMSTMTLLFLLSAISPCPNLVAQSIVPQDIIIELEKCQQDMSEARARIKRLEEALRTTNDLLLKRKFYSDTLIVNLREQIHIQQKINSSMVANADTLGKIIEAYELKLDEVNKLYIREMRKTGQPWWLSKQGLSGLAYGFFIGGALGTAYVVFK